MAAAIVFAVLSALTNACSAVLQRLAVVDRTSRDQPAWRTAIDLVRQPVWLLGALFLVGTYASRRSPCTSARCRWYSRSWCWS
jgi:uncharacterized membrane protein